MKRIRCLTWEESWWCSGSSTQEASGLWCRLIIWLSCWVFLAFGTMSWNFGKILAKCLSTDETTLILSRSLVILLILKRGGLLSWSRLLWRVHESRLSAAAASCHLTNESTNRRWLLLELRWWMRFGALWPLVLLIVSTKGLYSTRCTSHVLSEKTLILAKTHLRLRCLVDNLPLSTKKTESCVFCCLLCRKLILHICNLIRLARRAPMQALLFSIGVARWIWLLLLLLLTQKLLLSVGEASTSKDLADTLPLFRWRRA